MIITCQDCQSQYEVADEKVHGRSVRIRCRACGSRIFLSLEATTPPPAKVAARHAIAPPRDDSADATAPRQAAPAFSPFDDHPATGGRRETSVLFTLAALAGTRSASKVAAAPMRQDSGLIDLNAMATAELSAKSVKAPVLSEPPLGAFTTSVSYHPPAQARRAHLYGAGIAAVALLAMIALAFGMRGEKIESADVLAAAAPVVHTIAAVQPVAAAPAPAAPAPEVVASNSVVESKSAAPSKGKGKKGGKRGGGGVKPSGLKKIASTGVSGAPSAPPAAKAAANDACGCHGNLMCSMNCSAK